MAAKRSRKASSPGSDEERSAAPPRANVAALVVANNEAQSVADTVRAALSMPSVDLVIVVDDGSTDDTQDAAREAGATVVRHSHHRGRAAALETGVAVAGMRDEPGLPARHLLIMDAGLGDEAIGAAPLVPPVVEGVTDLAIALTDLPPNGRATGMAAALARNAIERACGWSPEQPLSRVRCLTREAFEEALPLSRGAGLEPGITLDVLLAGYSATEVPTDIPGRRLPASRRTPPMRMNRYREVMVAISSRRIRGSIEATQHVVGDRILNRNEEDE